MERSDEWGMNHLPKDIIIKLALELDLPSILNYCRSSKKFNNMVCNNYTFWMNKHLKDFNWNYTGPKTLGAIKDSYKTLSYWWNPKNHWELTDEIILETPGLLNLTSLNAAGNRKITDASVGKLTSLTYLNARNNPKITDESVGKLTSLRTLVAWNNPNITDRSISQLPNLVKVYR